MSKDYLPGIDKAYKIKDNYVYDRGTGLTLRVLDTSGHTQNAPENIIPNDTVS